MFGLEAGATYNFRATMVPHEGDRARISLGVATSQSIFFAVVGSVVNIQFVATATGLVVALQAANSSAWASTGEYAEFDDVSLRKILA